MTALILFGNKKEKEPIEFQNRAFNIMEVLGSVLGGDLPFSKSKNSLLAGDLQSFSVFFWEELQNIEKSLWRMTIIDGTGSIEMMERLASFVANRTIAAQLFREFAIEFAPLPNLGIEESAKKITSDRNKRFKQITIAQQISQQIFMLERVEPEALLKLETKCKLITALAYLSISVSTDSVTKYIVESFSFQEWDDYIEALQSSTPPTALSYRVQGINNFRKDFLKMFEPLWEAI